MGIAMDYKELLEKYNLLLGEVNRLTEENSQLKAQLGLTNSETPQNNASSIKSENNYRDDDSLIEIIFLMSITLRILSPRSVCSCHSSKVVMTYTRSDGRIKIKALQVIRLFA